MSDLRPGNFFIVVSLMFIFLSCRTCPRFCFFFLFSSFFVAIMKSWHMHNGIPCVHAHAWTLNHPCSMFKFCPANTVFLSRNVIFIREYSRLFLAYEYANGTRVYLISSPTARAPPSTPCFCSFFIPSGRHARVGTVFPVAMALKAAATSSCVGRTRLLAPRGAMMRTS